MGPKASHLARYLARWDVEVERERTRGADAEKEIERAFRGSAADLIVMSTYSRNRFRQLVLNSMCSVTPPI